MQFIFTQHAQERMDYHGISKEQVKKTITRGAKIPQTEGLVAVYTYIRVAYKSCGEKCVIKTVMIER